MSSGSVLGFLFPPGIFTLAFMQNAWVAGTAVAVVSGIVGFFVVLRGSSFVAHAVPRGSFAGAAGAVLIGQSTLLGLAVFALMSSLGIAVMRRGRENTVATALVLVAALGLGDFFLSIGNVYAPEVFSLLFGQIVGISRQQVFWVLVISLSIVVVVAFAYRPLLAQSVTPETAQVRGLRPRLMDAIFLVLVSAAATATVPVAGALLSFSLMVGPAAAASLLARRPATAMALGVGMAALSLWIALWLSYVTSWPIGFFVSSLCLLAYVVARLSIVRRQGHAKVLGSLEGAPL